MTMAGWGLLAAVWASADVVRLQDMTVRTPRAARRVRDLPAAVDVLDAATVRALIPVQVDELIRDVPGVDLQGSGFPGSEVKLNLRGLTPGFQSKRVLVLIDGRRANDAYQGNAEFALIPADAIDRIEVLRGPASALYGSNAMGGVLKIITRRGAADPYASLRAAAGSHATVHVRAAHGRAAGGVDYFVAGSRVSTEGYTDNRDGTDRDWCAWNGVGNIGWFPADNMELRLFGGAYQAEGTDANSERDIKKHYVHGLWRWQWGDGAELLAQAYRNGERQVYDWKFPGKGLYRLDTLGGDVQQSFRVGSAQRLIVGGEVRREHADIEEVAGPIDERDSTVGVFLEDEVNLGNHVLLTLGVRYDRRSDFGGEWSPRAGVLWRVCDATEVFASVNRAHRAPALSDRYVRTEFNGRLFLGNPDLAPETLTAFETGIRQRFGARVSAELVGFRNDLRDSFDFMMDADGVFRNRNVSESWTQGVEGAIRVSVTEQLSTFLNASYTDGEYERFADPSVEGNRLAYLAREKLTLGVNYRSAGGWSHTLRARYVGKRFGDAQNTTDNEMDDHVVLDWRSRVPLCERSSLTLNVDNVLDEAYAEFPGVEKPGTWVMGGLEVRF
jgi:outer membrane cobalamin receptor